MAAAEQVAEQALTPGGYITHHLTHFQNYKPASIADFGVKPYAAS